MILIDILYLYPVLWVIVVLMVFITVGQIIWYREIRRFVTSGNYIMHYQPIVASGHCKHIVALEAQICLPETFIRDGLSKEQVTSYIERHSWSRRFTMEVFYSVVRDYARHFRGMSVVIISINISPRDICCNELVDSILNSLRETRIPAGTFMLEITGRTQIPSKGLFIQNLHRLREGGVLLAIDDAGRGHSNDIIALRFPFDYVKTEIAILEDEHITCTENALRMAIHDARRGVIVERIQTAQDVSQAQVVCRQPLLQGGFYWRAMSASEASALLSQNIDMRSDRDDKK